MNRAERRRAGNKHQEIVPLNVRDGIASVVRGTTLIIPGGGTCKFRADLGAFLLLALGIECRRMLESMVFRAGPDRHRDFCGPHNTGELHQSGIFGHFWIKAPPFLIDFSCGDRPREFRPEAAQVFEGMEGFINRQEEVELGPVQWDHAPPDYIWQFEHSLTSPWRPDDAPKLGTAWYHEGVKLRGCSEEHATSVLASSYPFVETVWPAVIDNARQLRLWERLGLPASQADAGLQIIRRVLSAA